MTSNPNIAIAWHGQLNLVYADRQIHPANLQSQSSTTEGATPILSRAVKKFVIV